MSVTDQLLENNEKYAASFNGPLPLPPSKHVAVLACMDARLNVYGVLGLEEGESHVIRNAGGVVTDDEIRSLAISQRLLGTKEIVLIHHTDCGMLTFTDEQFADQLEGDTGQKPTWASESFTDLDADVRKSIARIKEQRVHPAHRPGTRASSSTSPPVGCARSSEVARRRTGGSSDPARTTSPGLSGGAGRAARGRCGS